MNGMDELNRYYKELLETMQKLEKAKTFEKFFRDIPPLKNIEKDMSNMPYIDSDNSYKEIKDHCYTRAAYCIHQATQNLSKAKALLAHLRNLYNSYAQDKSNITNPQLLKFLDDYEKDNGINNE